MEVRRERRAGFDLLVDWEHGEASCDWRRGVLTLEREGGDDRRGPKVRGVTVPHLSLPDAASALLSATLLPLFYCPGLACWGPRMPSAMADGYLPTNHAGKISSGALWLD